MNWLHMVDCIDLERSEHSVNTSEPTPKYIFWTMRIALDRVPEGVLLFRLKRFKLKTLIDARLAEKIQEAGIAGPQFYRVGGLREGNG